MTIKPFGERLIVKPIKEDSKIGTFVIPESAEREKKCQAEVICSNIKEIEKGVIVVYGEFDGANIKFDNEDLLILTKEEIIALII